MKKHCIFYKLIAGAMLIGGVLSSCDYLDIVPQEQATLDDAIMNAETTQGYLYACYNGLTKWNPVDHYSNEDVSSTDEMVLPMDNQTAATLIATNTISSSNFGNWYWESYGYAPIRTCYMFLEQLEKAPVSDADKRVWAAEAKILIAYYHFCVLRRYGPCPIVDKAYPAETSLEDMPGRSHYDAVTKFICDLIDQNVNDLPARWTDTNWGRIDQVIAKAIKARVLLYAASPLWNGNTMYQDWQNHSFETPNYGKELVSPTYSEQKWRDAEAACQEALDFALKNKLALYEESNFNELKDMEEGAEKEQMKKVLRMRYAVLGRANSAEGNTEMVWAMNNGDFLPVNGTLPRQMFKNSQNAWVGGWSTVGPTMFTIEHFYTKNGKIPAEDPTFSRPNEWFESSENAEGVAHMGNQLNKAEIIKLHTNREPRFYAWLGFSGGEYGTSLYGGEPYILNMRSCIDENGSNGYNSDSKDNTQTGYLSQKWIHPRMSMDKSTGSDNRGQLAAPRPLIRVAELYLNLAECQAVLQETDKALININKVRERAGVPKLTSSDLTSEWTLTEWVHNERFVEFWGEGIRFYDVRRWKEGKKYFGGPYYGLNVFEMENPQFGTFFKKTPIKQTIAWDDRLYMMPLKYDESGKTLNLIQAPGY
ncbi:RagB/SusD family nutrient uptake outer membrane protein [Bacteroides sp.]|uniref:RagB/SusD family nutrient uptake outer membrane protein n=1 Tax=Bacteroides sp. TaxID=29523 RepID=UPI0025C69194|nr:RagB/SusD family nutrient uptake outer membrane protein [Bacteroides sp.]